MDQESSSQLAAVMGMLTLDELRERIKNDDIRQVIISFPDMYGRLLGKIIDADFFLESNVENGTHCGSYLLACNIEMKSHPDYVCAHWQWFCDFRLSPDIKSLRLISWKDKTASVMCDVYDNNDLVPFAPRTILHRQIDAASKLSFQALSASELEYYTYENSYRDACAANYEKSKLKPLPDDFTDYHLLQTTSEEKIMTLFRHHLKASGIPIESSKAENGAGQHELNVKFSDLLSMADRHVTYKQCLKEIADGLGISLTFMAKPFDDEPGSGCHLHLSVVNAADGANVFTGDENIPGSNVKCSSLFKHFLAGWMTYTPDMMVFYAPTINSYKRFIHSSWAPTRVSWGYENRTVSFRIVGEGQSLRIECRLPGADCNIYLAFAAALASGLQGIRDKLPLPPMHDGDAYNSEDLPHIPQTLKEAVHLFKNSAFARQAFGDDVVNHYVVLHRNEQAAYDKAVTDWERHRYFKQI